MIKVGRLPSFEGGIISGRKIVRFIYVDEAGTSSRDVHSVVAGVVVHGDDELVPLEEHLEDLVARHIPEEDRANFRFHMTDLWHGSKYWNRNRWPREKRLEIVRDLATIPFKFRLPIVFGFARNSDAAINYPELADNKEAASLYSHALAFGSATLVSEGWMKRAHAGEVAQMVAENHDVARKYIQEAHGLFRNPREIAALGLNSEYLPLTRIRNNVLFAEKSECKPLQVADACAFIIRMHLRADVPLIDEFYQQLKPWLVVAQKGEPGYVPPIREKYPLGPLVLAYGEPVTS